MLGQGALNGKLNPQPGLSTEAVYPVPLDPLSKFGLDNSMTNAKGRPWTVNNCANGVRANSNNKLSDGLLNIANKLYDTNIYVMPTVLVSWQPPANQMIALQVNRLPLSMVNPQFAWSPS